MALSEAKLTQQVKDFLEAHGWRALRMQSGLVHGAAGRMRLGEPGMADFLFIWYMRKNAPPDMYGDLCLWVEFKRPEDRRKCTCVKNIGTKRRCTVCDQKNWKDREKQRGSMVWTVKDFVAFELLYRERFGWLHNGERAVGQTELAL